MGSRPIPRMVVVGEGHMIQERPKFLLKKKERPKLFSVLYFHRKIKSNAIEETIGFLVKLY
jgi:hypothetical protein